MKVILLTSDQFGTAAHHLPALLKSNSVEVTALVFAKGEITNKSKHYLKKLKKLFKIGIIGAINGIRMRKWYQVKGELQSIKEQCKNAGINYFEVPKINCKETKDIFKDSRAELGISLGNGYIGKSIFSIPKEGMINIHHEILPDYKNAQSVVWQVYNHSSQTGYTIHKIDEHIDNGAILYQEIIPISFKETLEKSVNATYNELLNASANGLVKVLNDYAHFTRDAKPQGKGRSYTTPSIWKFLRITKIFKAQKKNAAH